MIQYAVSISINRPLVSSSRSANSNDFFYKYTSLYLFIFQLQRSTVRLDAFSWCNRCPLPVSHHQHFYWVGRVFFFLRAPPHDCLRCTCTKSRLEQTELIALSLFDKYELNCLASEQTFVIFNKFYAYLN